MKPVPGVSAFGPYRVVREVGRGGMGAVYEVSHPDVPRRLALKLILEGVADDDALQRFEREAQLLAQVRHKNVLVVHAYGRASGGPYLVTDLVEGESLRQHLFDGPLEPARAARIVRDLADALAVVHAHGILHRDIKPENVLLQPDDTPVLLDFGLARELGGRRLTLTGEVVGTPAYMAPEQAGGASDERSDVYGLGALLFALLAGRAPFEGTNQMRILTRVMTEEPRWPSEDRPQVPPELDAICRVAMAKAPAQRHATARDLRDDLDRWLGGAPTWAGGRVELIVDLRRRTRRRRALIGVGLPLAALSLGLVAALAMRAPAPPPVSDVVVAGRFELDLSAPEAVLGDEVEVFCAVRGDDLGPVTVGIVGGDAPAQVRVGASPVRLVARGLEPGLRRITVFGERGGRREEPPPLEVVRWGQRKGEHPWPAPPARVRLTRVEGEYLNEPDGSVLLFVPAGRFYMATPDAYAGRAPNVTLSQGFFIGKTEVTRGQWRRFCAADRRASPPWPDGEDSLPATDVTRDAARAYAAWAGLRLPTAAEWEFAARGPESQVYPWGNEFAAGRANVGTDGPRPCGGSPGDRSPFGCLDLAGNVMEWVDDDFVPAPEGGHTDPRGGGERPTLRGGMWSLDLFLRARAAGGLSAPTSAAEAAYLLPTTCRASRRMGYAPEYAWVLEGCGLRVARDLR
ncbi:MAG: SUMF1/EgtB/PvdO family nonheme iron enzyme [Planctomycetes bacterium]|nr:SUMF1/EgtB/PvdO family nonheme iron enzyme [Planctomycetota bacterium]